MNKQPKFKEGDAVTLTAQYPDGDNHNFTRGSLKLGEKYTISTVDADCSSVDWCAGTFVYGLQDTDYIVSEPMLSPAEQVNQLDNTKIDVNAYAVEHGITLEQAHNEIQPWLFENGGLWCSCGDKVTNTHGFYLYTYPDKELTYGTELDTFQRDSRKQIFINRNVNVELTIKPETAKIEINGKTYLKDDVLKAISQLEQLIKEDKDEKC